MHEIIKLDAILFLDLLKNKLQVKQIDKSSKAKAVRKNLFDNNNNKITHKKGKCNAYRNWSIFK